MMSLGGAGKFLAAALLTTVLAGGARPAVEPRAAEGRPLLHDAAGFASGGAVFPAATASSAARGHGAICFIPGGVGERNEVVATIRQIRHERPAVIGERRSSTPGWSGVLAIWRQAHGVAPGTGPARIESAGSGHPAKRFDGETGLAIVHSVTQTPDRPSQVGDAAFLARRSKVRCELVTGRCSSLFEGRFVEEIASAFPGARFTAAVHDHRTGCSYHLNPSLALTTASVIKAQVLAGVLLAAQDQKRRLTASEAADVELMMHYSHNTPPASRLYVAIGGAAGMEALDGRFGIPGTTHTARYGATVSTAEDRTVLVEQLLIGGGPLDSRSVRAAWDWMSGVSVVQSWGVTAGLPAGYAAALKNGFYPSRYVGWRVGTTGVVRDPYGGAYAMTVLTDRNPDEASGIALVEAITGHVNAALTAGPPVARPVDAVTCLEPRPGWSWVSAAEALREVDPVALRRLNGGEPKPLAGQRICRP